MKKMRTRINSGSPVPFTVFVLHCSLLFSKDLKLTPSAYCKDRVLSFVMHIRSDCLLKMAVHKTDPDGSGNIVSCDRSRDPVRFSAQ